MEYLVDTDWAIDYLHRADRTVRRLEELFPDGVGLSIVSLAELYDGLARSRNPDADAETLRLFLEAVDVVLESEDLTVEGAGGVEDDITEPEASVGEADFCLAAGHEFTV